MKFLKTAKVTPGAKVTPIYGSEVLYILPDGGLSAKKEFADL